MPMSQGNSDRRFSAIKPLGTAHGTSALSGSFLYEFRRGCEGSVDRHVVSWYFEDLANNPVPRGGNIDPSRFKTKDPSSPEFSGEV